MSESNSLYDNLAIMGLTPEESSIYLLLLAKGSMSAKLIAEDQSIIWNSVYRLTNSLIVKGLVTQIDVSPKRFQAVTPSVGITKLADTMTAGLKTVSEELIAHLPARENPNRLNMELLTGREKLFERFVDLAKEAKQEILVISIGEPVPETIWDVTQKSIKNGLKTKFIFHKHDKNNIMLIKRWLAMGVALRHLPGEGYHLNVFDSQAAILSASNPNQTKERTGVVIYNDAIIEALRTYFYQQWSIAKIIH